MSGARGTRPPPRESDPVESLLDFLITLAKFTRLYGPRPTREDLDSELTRTLGEGKGMQKLRERRDARRRGADPGPNKR